MPVPKLRPRAGCGSDRLDPFRHVGDAAGVLDHLRGASCDVVVTDIRMPPTHTDEGIRLAHELRRFAPEVGVGVLSQFLEPDFALAPLDPGSPAHGSGRTGGGTGGNPGSDPGQRRAGRNAGGRTGCPGRARQRRLIPAIAARPIPFRISIRTNRGKRHG